MAHASLAHASLASTARSEATADTPAVSSGAAPARLSRGARWIVAGVALLLGVALLAAAGLLWARHGATVFFDTLSAGLGSCL